MLRFYQIAKYVFLWVNYFIVNAGQHIRVGPHLKIGGEVAWYYIVTIAVGGLLVALVGAGMVILFILEAADRAITKNG